MTSSREDDPESKVVGLLQQIKNGLAEYREGETAEERADRFEYLLTRVADVLTLYGANVFTLAIHQVQILKQLGEIEDVLHDKLSNKMPALPHFRQRTVWDDSSN